MHRRDRWAILGLLLALLDKEAASSDPAALSRIAQRANLPYDRFMLHLGELRDQGLLTSDARPRLTEKGHSLLASWNQWATVLQRFGLD
jgi:predicted transcriptional regulator